ncbi:hypothetical protein ACEXQE_06795 [Herbiconiux sp. P17]|uniref:hypothetical protein n=1 Tax=Herbiconiux wuyangfengii TaxID=3342794 RepID=UPI0035BB87C2
MGEFELKYGDYLSWHESASKSFLEPARVTAVRLLGELLDMRIDSVDRGRFRITTSRVKSAQRSFAKLSNSKYSGQVDDYSAVPRVLDDLVGVRLICNNLSDVNTFQEVAGELPIEEPGSDSLAIEHDSHRDYFSNPKPSGYRAYHVNLVVPVPGTSGNRRVRVEVQVRTLLQDGWGELTHEDTYKPGSTVPEWIVGMSLRMAELLAAVDNIAQDLRTGLDVETQRSVLSVGEAPTSQDIAFIGNESAELAIPTPHDLVPRAQVRDSTPILETSRRNLESEVAAALAKETKNLVGELTSPTALAVLSQRLTLVFGTEITKTWAQFGGFKKFLQVTVPEAKLSGPAPGYIHPPNTPVPDGWTTEDTGTGPVPEVVRELRTYDKAIPLVSAERIGQIILAVKRSLSSRSAQEQPNSNATVSQIESLARAARADAESREQLVVKPHAVYVLQALNRASRITSDLSEHDIKLVLFDRIMRMAGANSLIEDRDRTSTELEAWLEIKSD